MDDHVLSIDTPTTLDRTVMAAAPRARRRPRCQAGILTALLTWLAGCPEPPTAPALTLAVVEGQPELRRGELHLHQLTTWLLLDEQRVELATCSPETTARGNAIVQRGRCGEVEVHLSLTARDDAVAVAQVALWSSRDPRPRLGGLGLRGRVTGPGRPRGVYMEGFASWNAANFVVVEETSDIERVARTGDNDDYIASDARVSWWTSALAYPGAGLVSGALTAEAFKTRVLTYYDAASEREQVQWELRVGDTGDSVPVGSADTPLRSEALFIGLFDDAASGLDRYGREVASTNGLLPQPYQPRGWNSWNTFFSDISATIILDAAGAARAQLPTLALNNLQIDDGWEKAWGDWNANARFPDGMAALAARLDAQGFAPGLWWAPFLVAEELPLVSAQPDWFLRDAAGTPRLYQTTGDVHRYRVLDVTHPDARAFVVDTFARFVDQGYRYIKSDFLFAGTFEGARHDPDVTAVTAYRNLFGELASRAAERGVYLLACGAPLLPSVGRFHAIRTGEDIAAAHGGYSVLYNKNAFRNVAYRAYLRHALVSDPDTVLLRELAPGAQRINLTADLLAGSLLNLGDDLGALDGPRLELLRRVAEPPLSLALTGADAQRGFWALDLFAQRDQAFATKFEYFLTPDAYSVPARWMRPLDDGRLLLALFNWDPAPARVELELAQLRGDREGPVRELWSDRLLQPVDGVLQLDLPATDVLLLLL
ncbi:MAG: alpha-galactosidase [Pseudomonadota bacterium]